MNITHDLLTEWVACQPAKNAFFKVFGEAEVQWQEVVAHPMCTGAWAEWLKRRVGQFGNDEDRKVLRDDAGYLVRWTVAKYGGAENRAALRDDESPGVRWAVARYGNDEDRAALRGDPSTAVRAAVAMRSE